MSKPAIAMLVGLAAMLWAAPAVPVEAPSWAALLKRAPQFKGLAARYRIVDVQEGDLDGDGLKEYVAAFEARKKGCHRGGFAILAPRGGKIRVEWVGLFEHSRPESLAVQGGDIVAGVSTAHGKTRVVLSHGKDFLYRSDKKSPLAGLKIEASSQVKGAKAAQFAPANLVDGDTDSVWHTASVGTGSGEWVQVEFAKPVDLALVGVLGGDARGKQQWNDSNRLFRFEISLETVGDRTAIVEEKDITSMLNLPSTGKHLNAVAQDRRRTKWAEVREKQVLSVKVQAGSVYLGEKNDELYLSELDFGVLLPEPKLVEKPVEKPAPKPAPAPEPAPTAPKK
jgi:hypothetical protein